MSDVADTISEAVKRLRSRDLSLKVINLTNQLHMDDELAELIDCLLLHPDIIVRLYLCANRLTDEMGIKLARYVASSTTIKTLHLAYNRLGEATYLALATALRINTSLQYLYLYGNQRISIKDRSCVDVAFVDAFILNPSRPIGSGWGLYSWNQNEFDHLKATAEKLGHPSMQASLANQFIRI